jgi:hypothetical protein
MAENLDIRKGAVWQAVECFGFSLNNLLGLMRIAAARTLRGLAFVVTVGYGLAS